jgi:uncharacterized protein YqgC (DUF456 family)
MFCVECYQLKELQFVMKRSLNILINIFALLLLAMCISCGENDALPATTQNASNAAIQVLAPAHQGGSIPQEIAGNTSSNNPTEQKTWRNKFGNSAKHGGVVAAKLLLFIVACMVCITAIALSFLSFSGSWLILIMAAITLVVIKTPGWPTIIAFLLASIIGEVIEALSSFHGVKKRGGSGWAGLAGLGGSIAGAIIGSAIIPVIGSLIGLLAGTFLGVFLVEWGRLRHHGDATHIAWGAFYSRLFVLFIKMTSALVMSVWLLWCMALKIF